MPVRLLVEADLPSIVDIQRECYRPELIEAPETFRRKIEQFGAGCFGLEREGRIGGYVFCQPWKDGEILPLDDQGSIPSHCDCLYLHDLSVIPGWRGTGGAGALLAAVFGLARQLGYRRYGLVAVQSSEAFWRRQGFVPVREFEYAPGVSATYMVRRDS